MFGKKMLMIVMTVVVCLIFVCGCGERGPDSAGNNNSGNTGTTGTAGTITGPGTGVTDGGRPVSGIGTGEVIIPVVPGTKNYNELQVENYLLAFINADRAKAGLEVLRQDALLSHVARRHSYEMVRLRYFSHESPVPERQTLARRLALNGVGYAHASEIISTVKFKDAQTTAREIHEAFMKQEKQKAVIMCADCDSVGLGCIIGQEAYVTEIFVKSGSGAGRDLTDYSSTPPPPPTAEQQCLSNMAKILSAIECCRKKGNCAQNETPTMEKLISSGCLDKAPVCPETCQGYRIECSGGQCCVICQKHGKKCTGTATSTAPPPVSPGASGSNDAGAENVCRQNLAELRAAVSGYYRDRNSYAACPDISSLYQYGYLKSTPVCPAGGTYSISCQGNSCCVSCSRHGRECFTVSRPVTPGG